LEALRARDVERLVAVLGPEFVFHVDEASMQPGGQREVRGAENWARQAVRFAAGARFSRMALVDGEAGLVLAPQGRLSGVLKFTFAEGKIASVEVVGERARLEKMELAVLG
jgi:RNA polymerase sigma-70 factor (ECF subfamily)